MYQFTKKEIINASQFNKECTIFDDVIDDDYIVKKGSDNVYYKLELISGNIEPLITPPEWLNKLMNDYTNYKIALEWTHIWRNVTPFSLLVINPNLINGIVFECTTVKISSLKEYGGSTKFEFKNINDILNCIEYFKNK